MFPTKLKGQTILEVLLAVMLITITFVGLYSLNTGSIKQTSYSRNLSLATTYSSEGGDWLYNAKKAYGYDAIVTKFDQDAGAGNAVSYCLATLPDSSTLFQAMTPGVCSSDNYISGTIFLRSVTIDLSALASNVIEAEISTTWANNSSPGSTQSITIGKTQ